MIRERAAATLDWLSVCIEGQNACQPAAGGVLRPQRMHEFSGQRKTTNRFLQPIGFLCDHVEVLYDIDIAFREFAQKEGMRLWRAESLNESPTLIAALADVARSRLQPTGETKQQIVQIG